MIMLSNDISNIVAPDSGLECIPTQKVAGVVPRRRRSPRAKTIITESELATSRIGEGDTKKVSQVQASSKPGITGESYAKLWIDVYSHKWNHLIKTLVDFVAGLKARTGDEVDPLREHRDFQDDKSAARLYDALTANRRWEGSHRQKFTCSLVEFLRRAGPNGYKVRQWVWDFIRICVGDRVDVAELQRIVSVPRVYAADDSGDDNSVDNVMRCRITRYVVSKVHGVEKLVVDEARDPWCCVRDLTPLGDCDIEISPVSEARFETIRTDRLLSDLVRDEDAFLLCRRGRSELPRFIDKANIITDRRLSIRDIVGEWPYLEFGILEHWFTKVEVESVAMMVSRVSALIVGTDYQLPVQLFPVYRYNDITSRGIIKIHPVERLLGGSDRDGGDSSSDAGSCRSGSRERRPRTRPRGSERRSPSVGRGKSGPGSDPDPCSGGHPGDSTMENRRGVPGDSPSRGYDKSHGATRQSKRDKAVKDEQHRQFQEKRGKEDALKEARLELLEKLEESKAEVDRLVRLTEMMQAKLGIQHVDPKNVPINLCATAPANHTPIGLRAPQAGDALSQVFVAHDKFVSKDGADVPQGIWAVDFKADDDVKSKIITYIFGRYQILDGVDYTLRSAAGPLIDWARMKHESFDGVTIYLKFKGGLLGGVETDDSKIDQVVGEGRIWGEPVGPAVGGATDLDMGMVDQVVNLLSLPEATDESVPSNKLLQSQETIPQKMFEKPKPTLSERLGDTALNKLKDLVGSREFREVARAAVNLAPSLKNMSSADVQSETLQQLAEDKREVEYNAQLRREQEEARASGRGQGGTGLVDLTETARGNVERGLKPILGPFAEPVVRGAPMAGMGALGAGAALGTAATLAPFGLGAAALAPAMLAGGFGAPLMFKTAAAPMALPAAAPALAPLWAPPAAAASPANIALAAPTILADVVAAGFFGALMASTHARNNGTYANKREFECILANFNSTAKEIVARDSSLTIHSVLGTPAINLMPLTTMAICTVPVGGMTIYQTPTWRWAMSSHTAPMWQPDAGREYTLSEIPMAEGSLAITSSMSRIAGLVGSGVDLLALPGGSMTQGSTITNWVSNLMAYCQRNAGEVALSDIPFTNNVPCRLEAIRNMWSCYNSPANGCLPGEYHHIPDVDILSWWPPTHNGLNNGITSPFFPLSSHKSNFMVIRAATITSAEWLCFSSGNDGFGCGPLLNAVIPELGRRAQLDDIGGIINFVPVPVGAPAGYALDYLVGMFEHPFRLPNVRVERTIFTDSDTRHITGVDYNHAYVAAKFNDNEKALSGDVPIAGYHYIPGWSGLLTIQNPGIPAETRTNTMYVVFVQPTSGSLNKGYAMDLSGQGWAVPVVYNAWNDVSNAVINHYEGFPVDAVPVYPRISPIYNERALTIENSLRTLARFGFATETDMRRSKAVGIETSSVFLPLLPMMPMVTTGNGVLVCNCCADPQCSAVVDTWGVSPIDGGALRWSSNAWHNASTLNALPVLRPGTPEQHYLTELTSPSGVHPGAYAVTWGFYRNGASLAAHGEDAELGAPSFEIPADDWIRPCHIMSTRVPAITTLLDQIGGHFRWAEIRALGVAAMSGIFDLVVQKLGLTALEYARGREGNVDPTRASDMWDTLDIHWADWIIKAYGQLPFKVYHGTSRCHENSVRQWLAINNDAGALLNPPLFGRFSRLEIAKDLAMIGASLNLTQNTLVEFLGLNVSTNGLIPWKSLLERWPHAGKLLRRIRPEEPGGVERKWIRSGQAEETVWGDGVKGAICESQYGSAVSSIYSALRPANNPVPGGGVLNPPQAGHTSVLLYSSPLGFSRSPMLSGHHADWAARHGVLHTRLFGPVGTTRVSDTGTVTYGMIPPPLRIFDPVLNIDAMTEIAWSIEDGAVWNNPPSESPLQDSWSAIPKTGLIPSDVFISKNIARPVGAKSFPGKVGSAGGTN